MTRASHKYGGLPHKAQQGLSLVPVLYSAPWISWEAFQQRGLDSRQQRLLP